MLIINKTLIITALATIIADGWGDGNLDKSSNDALALQEDLKYNHNTEEEFDSEEVEMMVAALCEFSEYGSHDDDMYAVIENTIAQFDMEFANRMRAHRLLDDLGYQLVTVMVDGNEMTGYFPK